MIGPSVENSKVNFMCVISAVDFSPDHARNTNLQQAARRRRVDVWGVVADPKAACNTNGLVPSGALYFDRSASDLQICVQCRPDDASRRKFGMLATLRRSRLCVGNSNRSDDNAADCFDQIAVLST